MIGGIVKRARELVGGRDETVLDFLGVRAIDVDSGVIVMPDHIVAIIDMGGTDYLYSSYEGQAAITNAFKQMLNTARMSVQLFIDVRPIKWDLPGGYLDTIERQVPADSVDPWYKRRLNQHRDAVLRGEIDAVVAASQLRQLAVIRFAAGEATRREVPGESFAYQPPPEPWRFWEKVTYRFSGPRGLRDWRMNRRALTAALEKEVNKFVSDARTVPGFSPRRVRGVEFVQLLHLLWRDEAAYEEWIADEATLNELTSDSQLNGEVQHLGPQLPALEEEI